MTVEVEPEYREALEAITQRIIAAADDPLATLVATDEGIVAVLERIQRHEGHPDDNDVAMLLTLMASGMRILIAAFRADVE